MIEQTHDIKIVKKFLNKFNQKQENLDNPFNTYLVYKIEEKIIAFLSYSLIYDRIEIEYIYTLEEYRNKNIASKLIEHIVELGILNKCNNITLEVRKTNVTAIHFYIKNSFKEVGIRKNYYHNEDGILMLRELV